MRDRPEYLQKPPSARCFHNALPPSLPFSFPALTLSFHEMGIDPHGTHGNKDTIDLNAPCASLHYSNKNNETAGGLATPMNRGLGCVEYCTISSSNIAVLPTPLSLRVSARMRVCARMRRRKVTSCIPEQPKKSDNVCFRRGGLSKMVISRIWMTP